MPDHHRFEYDVALSFAKEDETVARRLGELLSSATIRVLYDEYGAAQLGGGNFITHIAELYRTKAQYCVMLISKHYPLEKWTSAERTFAQQHALRDADEYILLIRVDDTNLRGLDGAKGVKDLRQETVEGLVAWLEKKLKEKKPPAGPPEESHDLRSGNLH